MRGLRHVFATCLLYIDHMIRFIALMALIAAGTCRADIYVRTTDTEDGEISLTNLPADSAYMLLIADQEKAATPRQERDEIELDSDKLPYDHLVKQAAASTQLEPALIHAMIAVESGHQAKARSIKGAQGLMQLMPDTSKAYAVNDPYNPAQNILAGARYLKSLLTLYGGDLSLALAAYNAGPQNVNRYGRQIPPFTETRNYVARVLRKYRS